jgi:tetratricopeptide (TPR) repeat protein
MELGELYVRQGRFGEALSALRKVPEYRMQRPPHVREADRGETRRVLAGFLLVMGKAAEAAEVTGRAIAAPDRRAHNSRDPAQDESVIALLDRAAHRTQMELELEHAATLPFWERPLAWLRALRSFLDGRRSAARIEKLLDRDERLAGLFRIGQSSAAIMPPWVVGELVTVVGAGPARAAVARARSTDEREGAGAYYDAFATEVAWAQGEDTEALRLAQRSLERLGQGEVLLAARVHALAADAARRLGKLDQAQSHYDSAFQRDPGVLRRLGLPVAIRVRVSGALGAEIADMLEAMPRFEHGDSGLLLEVQADRASARACLISSRGQSLTCGEVDGKSAPADEPYAPYAARELVQQLFAPRVDLSQTDINSLDGQNLSGRDALRQVLE